MSTGKLEWKPAPIADHYPFGKRWLLLRDGRPVGRVTQLMPNGYWEASRDGSHHFYSPGHATIRDAARVLLISLSEPA